MLHIGKILINAALLRDGNQDSLSNSPIGNIL